MTGTDYPIALPPRHALLEYRIERVLGHGGFGITYLATDTTLRRTVAIKEYLPAQFAVRAEGATVMPRTRRMAKDYRWGLDRFLDEARTLARFRHVNIVPVLRFFEANGTAYIVMEYEDGRALADLLGGPARLPALRVRVLLEGLMDGLVQVHGAGFLHRDIKPSNIIVRPDGVPVLIDFGAARQALLRGGGTLTSIVTPRYAPLEQYQADAEQGAWTDIYALAAVAYHTIAGEPPPEAPARVRKDPYRALAGQAAAGHDLAFLTAIDQALAVHPEDRPQTVTAWRQTMGPAPVDSALVDALVEDTPAAAPTRLMDTPLTQTGSTSHGSDGAPAPGGFRLRGPASDDRPSRPGADADAVPAGFRLRGLASEDRPSSPAPRRSGHARAIAVLVLLGAAAGGGVYAWASGWIGDGGARRADTGQTTAPPPPAVAVHPPSSKPGDPTAAPAGKPPPAATVQPPSSKPGDPAASPAGKPPPAATVQPPGSKPADPPPSPTGKPPSAARPEPKGGDPVPVRPPGTGGPGSIDELLSKDGPAPPASPPAATQAMRDKMLESTRQVAVRAQASAEQAERARRRGMERAGEARIRAAEAGKTDLQGAEPVRFDDGSSYHGQLAAGRRSGLGVAQLKTGERQAGEWKEDHLEGLGVLRAADGRGYEGDWHNGLPEGAGVFRLGTDERYLGEVRAGQPHGAGVRVVGTGAESLSRVGTWQNGALDGVGVESTASGWRYEGVFRAGKRHGPGVLVSPDGTRFHGTFVDGVADGYGVSVAPDGRVSSGEWRAGKLVRADD